MHELAEAGCVAISNDGLPVADTEIFRRVMEYAADLDLIVIDHCEDPCLARKAQMNEGRVSGLLGLKGQPDVGETIQAARSVLLAEFFRADGRPHCLEQGARRARHGGNLPALPDAR